jgi:hypothetical protein
MGVLTWSHCTCCGPRREAEDFDVVLMTAFGSLDTAIQAIRAGATISSPSRPRAQVVFLSERADVRPRPGYFSGFG